ncbi:hypothetical protein RQP46_011317 [Phenoliferia psychrophenolica]
MSCSAVLVNLLRVVLEAIGLGDSASSAPVGEGGAPVPISSSAAKVYLSQRKYTGKTLRVPGDLDIVRTVALRPSWNGSQILFTKKTKHIYFCRIMSFR